MSNGQNPVHKYYEAENEVLRGKIINTGGNEDNEDPIAIMDEDLPNTVIKDLEPEDAEMGQRVKVRIDNALENVMFGHLIEDEEDQQSDSGDSDYRVEFEMFGYTFQSENLDSEGGAEDLADYLNDKINKETEVVRTR